MTTPAKQKPLPVSGAHTTPDKETTVTPQRKQRVEKTPEEKEAIAAKRRQTTAAKKATKGPPSGKPSEPHSIEG